MLTHKIRAAELKPNDCFEVAGVNVRVRYLRWHHSDIDSICSTVDIDLQRFEDKLHPLCDKTFMRLNMKQAEMIEVRRNV